MRGIKQILIFSLIAVLASQSVCVSYAKEYYTYGLSVQGSTKVGELSTEQVVVDGDVAQEDVEENIEEDSETEHVSETGEISEGNEDILPEEGVLESKEDDTEESSSEAIEDVASEEDSSVAEPSIALDNDAENTEGSTVSGNDVSETEEAVESDNELTEEEKEALFEQTVSYELIEDEENRYINVTGLLADIDPVETLVIPANINIAAEGEAEDRVAIKNINERAFYCNTDIKAIVCDAELDSIGTYAFYGCTSIENVVLNSVNKVGDYAFYNCNKIAKIQAQSIAEIASYTFQNCRELCNFEVASIGKIGNRAFYNCIKLVEIQLDTSEEIGTEAFTYCSALENVSLQNVQLIGNKAFYNCVALTSVAADSLQTLDSYAFYGCKALTSVQMKTVLSVGDYAFSGCTSLTTVDLGENVTTLGNYVFANDTALTSIGFPESLTNAGSYLFYACNNLEEITSFGGITSIPNYCFYNCAALERVDLDNITVIGSNAFENCYALTTIVADAVQELGSSAFYRCTALESVQFKNIVTINNYAFRACTNLATIDFGESLETIGNYAFESNAALKSVNLPDSVTSLGTYVFSNCSQLEEVTSLGGVTVIPASCFNNCQLLATINLEGITKIDGNAFYCCYALTSIAVDDVQEIGSRAFYRCTALETVQIKNVVIIGNEAFQACSNLTQVEVGENLTTLGSYAFNNNANLTSVILPETLTSIGNYAFAGCTKLVEIGSLGSITYIPGNCFYNCAALEALIIPDSVTQIGANAFYGCSKIKELSFGENVTSIGSSAFYGCELLEKVEIAGTLSSMGTYVFQECKALKSVELTGTFTTLPHNTFNGCENLETFIYNGTLTSISDSAFKNCKALSAKSVENILSNAVTVGANAFYGCTKLVEVVIPETALSMGNYAFAECTALSSVIIHSQGTALGNYLFQNCPIETIQLPEGMTEIPTGIFKESDIKQFTFPDNIKTISDYAFYGCDNLEEIVIPETVTRIGLRAFSYCTNLKSVTLPKKLSRVDKYIFEGDTNLTEIHFDKAMEKIPAYLFYGSSFEKIEIPETIEKIDKQAFYANRNLTLVKVKNVNMEYLEDDIFSQNSKLTLCGYKNSTTQAYAKKNGISFSYFTNIEVEAIALNSIQSKMMPGDELKLDVSYTPVYATENKEVTFTSSDEQIVTVDETGLVKALAVGNATITATSKTGLSAICSIEVAMPEKPENLYAITNIQKTLGDIALSGYEKWSFSNPENVFVAQNIRKEQYFDAIYQKDNGDVLEDAIKVAITTVNGIRIEGDHKVSLEGNDSLELSAIIDIEGAPLEESRYEVVWSVTGKHAVITNKDKDSLSIVGTKVGTESVTAELYLLNEDGYRAKREENVTYFKFVKEIEVTENPVIRGIYFSQNGLSDDAVEADNLKGIASIHMFPDKMVSKFTLTATPYYYNIDNVLTPINKALKYSSSDKSIASVAVDKSGTVTVAIKKVGIVQITATEAESGYTESFTLAVIDYMPRLSLDTVTMNLYKEKPTANIYLYPAYENYYQCDVVDAALEIVYRDKNGVVTESEFNIQKAEEDYSYQIGIKEGEALKKGKKKVYLAAKVKGSAMIGSEIYYIPLTISLTEQKPKVTYEQNAIQTFYKDSTGNLTVMSEDAQVKSVSFIPNTKAGKAGLEAIAVDGVANQLMIIPNDCLKNEYTEKFNNKGNLLISFEGYKENANILVKNFKLAADKTKPVISKDYDTVKIYTDISTKAKLTMYSNGEVIMPSNGYTISWKDEKTKSKDAFSYEQSESDGTIEITSISAKSGTLDLKIASDAWNDVILSSTKINVEKAPKVKVSTNKVVLNQAVGTQMLQPITVSVDGNSNIDITDIKLLPIKEADTEMLDNISQTFDETTTSIMLALKEGVLLEKDYKDNYKLVATLERNQRQVEVSSNIQLQIAIEEPVVTVKSSKFIDSVKRENTYVLCTPKFENIAGAIKAVSLEGTYKNHFVATYVDAPNNKGQVIIKAKSSSGGKNYVLRAGDVYKFKLNFTLDNGQCLKSNEFKVPVKQSKLAVKSDVKNMNLYGSLEGKAYGKVIQFAVSNIKTEEINAIELSSFQDVFAFDYMGNGKGLLYIKDVDKFSGQKSYNLKFNVNTVNTLIGGNVAAVTVKIKNKPVKLSAYDSQKKIFGLYTDNLVYDDDTGVYCIVEKIDKLAGKVNRGYEVSDASYVITDDRNHELISGEFDATGEWEITKLAFLFGGNILILSGTLPDGSIVKEEYTIYNMTNENIGELDTKDDDADGLVNYLEIYYDCDKNDADTDNDGLNDYTECVEINTNPCLVDTDDNGITDFDEDADGDGISNGKEVDLGTKPHDVDSDADTLADGDELNKYGTSPVKADTDGDRVDDNVEVEIGTNPLTADTAFDVTEEVEGNPNVGAVPGVEVLDLKADQVDTLEIAPVTAVDNPLLSSTIPGFMGSAYNFEVDGTFENATITFAYSDALLEDDKSAVPTIYYYNEETQALEEVPGQTISNHQVSVPVTHFSTYILLNKTEYQTVWENDVRKPSEDGSGVASIDIAFVIDDSGSMSGNDKANLRISLTQGFLDELRDVDRAAAIRFTSASTILSSFTTDKEAVKESLIANSSGGTDIKSGINSALNEFDKIKTEDDSRISKIMFVLTDGDDGYSNSAYDEYIDIAIENSIKIYTVGLGSPNEDKLKYIAEASGGKYYYATSVSDLEECYEDIEEEVVADVTDSNGDGISDYYTQKICDGDLTTATGYNPFAGMSYETIQKNADYDGDGLKNGEEIEVCATIYGAYIRMNSDPLRKYSDFDTYNDYEEKQQGTDPMNANVFIKKSNVDYLTNDTNFVADNYRIQYNDNFLTQAGVWIGNGIGINSKTETARDMLLSYMSDLNEGEGAYCEDEMWLISAYSWLTGARDNVSKGVDISKFKTSDAPATKTLLENSVTGINNAMDKLVELSGREGTNAKASQIMQGAATHYNNLVSHLPDLDKTVKVIDKAGDILGIVGYVVTAADIINGAFAYHADVAAHMEMLQENIYILDYIIGESQNSFVVAGAKELRGSLESDRDLVLHTLKTFAISAGTTIAVEAVKAAIGSVVPYGTAAMIILDLTDAIFQISDMSERFVQVYTIAEAAHILAAHVKADIASQRTISCNFGQIYVISPNNKVLSKNRIHNLASARYLEELTMKETDDEIKWWTAWIYREKWYDGDKIDSNLVRTKALRQS